jgi:hypothetical protein
MNEEKNENKLMNKYFQVPCNNIKNCKNGGKTIIDLKYGPGSDPYRCKCSKGCLGDLCDKFGKICISCKFNTL